MGFNAAKFLEENPDVLKLMEHLANKRGNAPGEQNSIIDAQPAPYQMREDVDEGNNDIIVYVGDREMGRYHIHKPDWNRKNIGDIPGYQDELRQAIEDRKTVAAVVKELQSRIEAINAAQAPDRLLEMVVGSKTAGVTPETLISLTDELICPTCKQGFKTPKALNFHMMQAGHGEYAEGMPKWELSGPYRRRKAKDAKEASDGGTGPDGSAESE